MTVRTLTKKSVTGMGMLVIGDGEGVKIHEQERQSCRALTATL